MSSGRRAPDRPSTQSRSAHLRAVRARALPPTTPAEPPPADATAPGQVLADRYLLGEPVGDGTAAQVFRARDQILDRDVAVKVLRGSLGSTGRQRAIRAARAAERATHENLLPVLDVNGGRPAFLVLPLVDGRPLAELGAPLAEDEARVIVPGLLAGLSALHEAGLVHRAVTAENVLIDRGGAALLTGAGLAEAAADPGLAAGAADDPARDRQPPPEPEPGRTPDQRTSMSDERPSPQQELGLTPDQRTDVYAAGKLVRTLLPGTNRGLDAVLARALAEDPDERYPDAGALLQALRAPLAGPLTRSAPPADADEPLVAAPARRSGPLLALAAALVLVVVAVVVLVLRGNPATDPSAVAAAVPAPTPADAQPAPVLPPPAPPGQSPLTTLIADAERDPAALGPAGSTLLTRLRRLESLSGEQRSGEIAGVYGAAVVGSASGGVDSAFAERIVAVLGPELDQRALLAYVSGNPQSTGQRGPSLLSSLQDLVDNPEGQRTARGAELGELTEQWTRQGELSAAVGAASIAALNGVEAGTVRSAEQTVQVPAAGGFVDTGLDLPAGATVSLLGSGEITADGEATGPDGLDPSADLRGDNVLPDAGHAALLGRVGEGRPFVVGGDGLLFTIVTGGRLYLGVNDTETDDNEGSFDVRVAVFS